MQAAMRFLLAAATALSACLSLPAATVTLNAASNLPLDFDSNFCTQTALVATCAINPGFSDPTGRHSAGGNLFATAQFGSASGSFAGGIDRDANLSAEYLAFFSEYVMVTGGMGSGTLVSHYTLTSSGEETRNPWVPISPTYRIEQGPTVLQPQLLLPSVGFPMFQRLTEQLDVSSTFDFGVPFLLGAGTRFNLNATNISVDGWSGSSSVVLTGYTILDAQGQPIAGAQIVRSFADNPGVFIPEPSIAPVLAALILAGFVSAWRGRGTDPAPHHRQKGCHR